MRCAFRRFTTSSIATAVPESARLALLVLAVVLPLSSNVPAASAELGPMLRRCLDGPMAGAEEIVFAERVAGRDHWYANFGFYCNHTAFSRRAAQGEEGPLLRAYGKGGRLCRLNLRTGRLQVLLDDPEGAVRDPVVHYDGQKILFAYRPGGSHTYHLYEIRTDGAGLVQLTDGPDDDIEPTYLPDGGIMFVSSRCRRAVPCWHTRVAILYRCDGDGRGVRPISSNAEHENTPWVLPDGRVLYMRWEYVDRNQLLYHHLWTVNPDGTGVMVFYGNQFPGVAMLDAKPIPGTRKVVASFSPGHGHPEHAGQITVVDPAEGPDQRGAARPISKGKSLFRDPYPLSEDCFLAANAQGIWVMDGRGDTELIYRPDQAHANLQCHEPQPLRSRPREPVIPPRVDLARATGRLVLSDIYAGRNMAKVRRGEIKRLLVLEQLPKPANFSGGQEPLNIGGTFTLQRVLGTVPVEPDGSASMEVPALRSLFFVALDENDLSVKRMQSFVTVQPGETTGCVGCHEPRTQALRARPELLALKRPPSVIEPIEGIPDVLDYPRDVQPILDRHCVRCHNADRRDGSVDLSGDHTPLYSTSYWTIAFRGLFSDGRNLYGNQPPRAIGSSASRLLKLVDGSHYEAKPLPAERDVIRLWIESGASYAGTYAALGSGMYPVKFPVATMDRRCAGCHRAAPKPGKDPGKTTNYKFGPADPPQPLCTEAEDIILIRHLAYYKPGDAPLLQSLCNLDRPEKSRLLRAPLSRRDGGLGLCSPEVFVDRVDPDYQEMLRAIVAARGEFLTKKRFDLPGFRPNDDYLREMRQFGVLRADLGGDEPIDCYTLEQAYWRSFWWTPGTIRTELGSSQP